MFTIEREAALCYNTEVIKVAFSSIEKGSAIWVRT